MTQTEAFHLCTEEQIESALRKAWDDNGSCRTCGWWSAFYEVSDDLDPLNHGIADEWTTFCHSKDDPEGDHKLIHLYPDFIKELNHDPNTI